jgi:hypothetical protein
MVFFGLPIEMVDLGLKGFMNLGWFLVFQPFLGYLMS